ncbi:DUF4330 family protein [Halonotius sp. GCM10025705]|uniref:DUF4330 family protein n=1 Tax=Halonotius sp. GCM10025705 TaxID=3252678 RepID=UPI00361B5A95
MELIDEEGNLFGAINIIDALAVLLVVAVLVAGVALVVSQGSSPSDLDSDTAEIQYATVYFGGQPNYLADRVAVGDNMTQNGNESVLTDRHLTAVDGSTAALTGRIKLNGTHDIRVGDTFTMDTDAYTIEGTVHRLDATDEQLDLTERSVEMQVVTDNPDTINAISEGVPLTERNPRLLTVQQLKIQPDEAVVTSEDGNIYRRDHPTRKDIRMIVDIQTIETTSGAAFRGQPLRVGRTIDLDLGTTAVSGSVTEIDSE